MHIYIYIERERELLPYITLYHVILYTTSCVYDMLRRGCAGDARGPAWATTHHYSFYSECSCLTFDSRQNN